MDYVEEWGRLVDTIEGMKNNTGYTLDHMEQSIQPRSEAFGFVQGERDGYDIALTFARVVTIPGKEAVVNLKRVLGDLRRSDTGTDPCADIWHIGRAHAFMNVIVLLGQMLGEEGGRSE